MTTIHARPERTPTEIAADAGAATEFWRSLQSPARRKWLVHRESYDYKLLMADKEGREWARRQNKNDIAGRAARRAARLAADPLANRLDENLRHYVDANTKAQMPRIALHGRAKGERALSLQTTYTWFYGLNTPSPQRRTRVRRESEMFYEHWLLCNPQYGPVRAGGELFEHTVQTWNYIPGQIRPAGMSPERALQIALSVLDENNGVWPDNPPPLL
ncbi:MAG: hypothetical protein KF761_14455 [Salinibacterium sp.]|nr:hypothetical protein [Salinibacterium sp.]